MTAAKPPAKVAAKAVGARVSRIPANAPRPQDRRPRKTPAQKKAAARAREAEAVDGFVTVEQCGIALNIPIGEKVPLAAYMAFEDGDELKGTELLLGEKQWAEFLAAGPTIGDFAAIGKQLEELTGN